MSANEKPRFDLGSVGAEPHTLYRALREGCPVLRTGGQGGVVLSRHDDVLFALRHPEIFSSVDNVAIGNERPLIPLQIE